MKITKQSIKWLGDNRVRITTVRSKSGGGSWVSIWGVGVSSHSRGRSARTSDVLRMDYQRYLIEHREIQRGRFKDYDPSEYYEYNSEKAYTPEEQFKQTIAAINERYALEEQFKQTIVAINEKLSAWIGKRQHQRNQRRKARAEQRQSDERAANTSSARLSERVVDTSSSGLNWWRAVVTASVIWVLWMFAVGVVAVGTILDTIAAGVMFVVWVLLPVAIYKDAAVATIQIPDWQPRVWVYVLSALVPVISGVVGVTYLVRRWWHERSAVDTPSWIVSWLKHLPGFARCGPVGAVATFGYVLVATVVIAGIVTGAAGPPSVTATTNTTDTVSTTTPQPTTTATGALTPAGSYSDDDAGDDDDIHVYGGGSGSSSDGYDGGYDGDYGGGGDGIDVDVGGDGINIDWI